MFVSAHAEIQIKTGVLIDERANRAQIARTVGAIVAPFGRLSRVLTFTFAGDKVTRIDVIGDAARLRELEIIAL